MLPDGKALGGSPTNVAWHAAQLGAEAHVVSAVGKDDLGDEILSRLGAMRLHVDLVAVIPGKPTSVVDAMLDADGNATYVIRENVAWDYLPASPGALELAGNADAVNFGSLSQRNPAARRATLDILDRTPKKCIRIFDINLRTPFVAEDVLSGGMARATVAKMNDDELAVVAGIYGWPGDPEAAVAGLFRRFPNLRHVVVTRGAKGAWWHDGRRFIAKAPGVEVKTVDTIGAGDSFTASVMMGLLRGWEAERIMDRALSVASFVCTRRGGTPELPGSLRALFALEVRKD